MADCSFLDTRYSGTRYSGTRIRLSIHFTRRIYFGFFLGDDRNNINSEGTRSSTPTFGEDEDGN